MGVKYNFQLRLSQPWKEVEAVFACNPDAFGRLMARVPERDQSVQLETMTVKSMLVILDLIPVWNCWKAVMGLLL